MNSVQQDYNESNPLLVGKESEKNDVKTTKPSRETTSRTGDTRFLNDDDSFSSQDVENSFDMKSSRHKNMKSRYRHRRSLCHSIFVIIQIAAVCSTISWLATQIIPLFICHISLVDAVIRCYLALFAFFFFLTELECPCITSPTLINWISRGFLYTFFGVVQMEQGIAMVSDGSFSRSPPFSQVFYFNIQWTLLFVQISSWMIVCIGIIYFFCGVTCLQQYLNKIRLDYQRIHSR